ncbi:MAG TPA: PEP-CTERM sorting domain-containing protein [Bryobacteraceae bacterium]|nr:PEP-CTERM sorting domain-containing protein [Bryobacteraceae bacterium]
MGNWLFAGKYAATGLAVAGLALTAAVPTRAATIGATDTSDGTTTFKVSGAISITDPLIDLWIVYSGSGNGTTKSGEKEISPGPAAGTISPANPVTVSVPGYINSGYATVLAVYETLSLPQDSAQLAAKPTGVGAIVDSTKAPGDVGKDFSTAFKTTAGQTDEATMMGILESGSDPHAYLLKFLNDNSSQFVHFTDATNGASWTLVDFSSGFVGGTGVISVNSTNAAVAGVPEPSAALLLLGGLGFIGVGRFRRKRK